jgi:hypothetical protein
MDLSEAQWRKSKRSAAHGGECVELAAVSGIVAFRDSKDPTGPKVLISHGGLRRLLEAVKSV